MPRDYDRYELVRTDDGTLDQLPFVPIAESPTDKFEEWIEGRSRLDKIAQRYYGNPFFDWLILYANPSYISEFDIPDGTVIRIPFPLDDARTAYENKLTQLRNR